MKKSMQCKHIPTLPILAFIRDRNSRGRTCTWYGEGFEGSVHEACPPGTPPKLVLAKMKALIRSGLVAGSDSADSRGDYELTEAGRARLAEATDQA